jgi:dTDP-4-dehydrorhamnose reductase
VRIVVTGAGGQLGSQFVSVLGSEHEIIPLSHDQFELESPSTADRIAATAADLVIHPAAYTNVDGCARDPDLAYRVNGLGTRYVALGCRRLGVPLVYISTNEVFAGDAAEPYREYDPVAPVNAYGRSKLAGELALRELLDRYYIVRVAWLFGGARNFVRTVVRLAAAPPEGGLRMVADEIGNPTYTHDVATAVQQLITTDQYGTYHFVNSGACSRYDFARAIMDRAGYAEVPLTPIRLAEYRRDSTPPPYSALANPAGAALGITLRPWSEALDAYLATVDD